MINICQKTKANNSKATFFEANQSLKLCLENQIKQSAFGDVFTKIEVVLYFACSLFYEQEY